MSTNIRHLFDLIRNNGPKGIVLDGTKKDLVVELSQDEGYPDASTDCCQSLVTFEFVIGEHLHRINLTLAGINEGNFQPNGDFQCADSEGGTTTISFASSLVTLLETCVQDSLASDSELSKLKQELVTIEAKIEKREQEILVQAKKELSIQFSTEVDQDLFEKSNVIG